MSVTPRKTTPRVPPSNTPKGQALLIEGAIKAKGIKPTKALSSEGMRCFLDIINSREGITWLPHDIRIATELAKLTVLLSGMTDRMLEEEPTLLNARGTQVSNPVYAITMQLSSTVQALSRTLGLNAASKGLVTPQQGKRNAASLAAQNVIENAMESSGGLL